LHLEASFGPQNLLRSVATVCCQYVFPVRDSIDQSPTLGSLLIVGILKAASVPAYLLEAICAPVQAAGSAPRDLVAERNGWTLFEETIVLLCEYLLQCK
jgi:hypothetical protein